MEDESKEYGKIIHEYGSKCSSFLEFGTRGGMSATAIINALKYGNNGSKWQPRFVGVDLITNPSIEMLTKNSKELGISFQFWQGHSSQYPIHETDGFLWDIFHCGGSLFNDLVRISPYVNKYIIILGVRMFATDSEAVVKGFDIQAVSRELHVSVDEAKMGLKEAINKFINSQNEWKINREFAEMCILSRNSPSTKSLFRA